MPPELHQRVRELFDEALERPEGERLTFIEAACAGDGEAYQALVRLLEAREQAQSFFDDRPRGVDRIGRFLVTAELGRGAMGVVYDAIDPLIGRNVALKVIHIESFPDRSEADFMRNSLFREARAAGRLLHPGIVVVFDVGQEDDLAFIAMERVDGWSLDRILSSGRRLSRAETFDALRQTAEALDYAHRHQIVHRDVKPGNIIVDKSGVVKLTDFGIAKTTSTQHQTRSGLVMGTPSYMSPEQIEGQLLDGRADQFSLAVVAFELLAGARPFHADTFAGMAYAIVNGKRPSAHAANPELPAAADKVFASGLARLPEKRFSSCAEFVAALENALEGVPSIPARRSKSWARKVGPYLAGVLLLGLVGAGALGIRMKVPTHAPGPASIAPVASLMPQPRATPVIAQFAADPPSIKAGSFTTLRWNVAGAAAVSIDPDIGAVKATQAAKLNPPTTTVFTLTATGPDGGKTTSQLEVTVDDGPSAAAIYVQADSEKRAGHLEKALALFRQAADQGEVRAMLELGNMSVEGEGMPQNYAEGMHWLRLAADRGNSTGMLLLGGLYYLGKGVPADSAVAAYWFGKASGSGDPAAKFDLGMLYENGQGVSKDVGKAIQLYQEAATLGNEEARKHLLQLPRKP